MTFSGVRPDDSFRLLDRDVKFRGKVVTVSVDHIRLPGGHETRHEVLHLPGAVCVVPLLRRDDGELDVILIEQFRNSVEGFIHEIPAGVIEPGEEPAECAARELEEETGYSAETIRPLTTLFPIPGTSAHRMYFFLAEGLTPGQQRLEAAECLSVKRVPLLPLVRSVLSPSGAAGGELSDGVRIVDAKTHIGILHAGILNGLAETQGDDR